MPWVIRKIRGKNLYSVKNPKTGAVHSKGTTLKKAQAQIKLSWLLNRRRSMIKK
jgi:hypothetical protein